MAFSSYLLQVIAQEQSLLTVNSGSTSTSAGLCRIETGFVKAGYARGVPMGGDLKAPAAEAPTFMVMAAKDPKSGNLDRIQIIKGWLDAAGAQHEKIYDVAWERRA